MDTVTRGSQSDDPAQSRATYLGHMIENNDLLGSLELPDLKVEDVESVISEHTDWSGEQIESFLKSLDLSVIDNHGGLCYDSDSGYSTYDVSPLGSSTSSSAHYHSALSPAITPVTPTPLLSPSPFYPPYQDDFNACSFSFPTPRPLSATSSTEGHFLFNSDLTVLPATPTDNLSEYSFPPTPYQTDFVPSPTHYQYQQQMPHLLMAPPTSVATLEGVPKLLQVGQEGICAPPTSNPCNMEDNKHTVLVIPNAFSIDASRASHPPSSAVPITIKQERMSPSPTRSQAPSMVDSAFQTATVPTFGCYSNGNAPTKDCPSRMGETQSHVDPTRPRTPRCKDDFSLPHFAAAKGGEPISLCSEGGRTVYAQIVPSSTKLNQYDISKIMGKTAALSKGKGKGFKHSRQRSSSLSVKTGGRKSRSQWPKSISSGNLIAFRNFILNKLKKTNDPSLMSMAAAGPSGMGWMTAIDEGSIVDAGPGEDPAVIKICNNFNPDALLTSDGSIDGLSPPTLVRVGSAESLTPPFFDHTLSLESCFKFSCGGGGSCSSLDAADNRMLSYSRDLEEYAEFLSLDPLSQSLSEPDIAASALDSIFKTDADPLLGAST